MQEPGLEISTSPNDDSLSVDIQRMSLESAIRQAAEAIVITSATGKIQYVNPAFTRMTGYRSDEVLGHYPNVLKSGTQDPVYYEQLWQTIRAGRVWRGELINRRKDGSFYTEEMSITPVLNASGRITSYIAIKQDVTERRAAEAARQFLAAIVASTEDAVVGSTLDGKILAWNHGAEKLHGYAAEEVLGQPVEILLAPEHHDQCRRIAQGLLRGRTFPRFDCTAMRKSGERVQVSLSVSLIRNWAGQPTGSAAIIRDVTAARRIARELRNNEARFRTAFERAPFGMCITTADSHILRVNETFCRMLGYSAEELLELGWWDITHPEDQEQCLRIYQQMLLEHESSVEFLKRYIHKQGHTVCARVSMSAIDLDGLCEFLAHVQEVDS
uniref:Putative PAS/PAC sensor protein n=1 Tax=Solibacter usitatus (strain Ellin6076) TaxID=234267 RepID=Q029L5_SOLUE